MDRPNGKPARVEVQSEEADGEVEGFPRYLVAVDECAEGAVDGD